MRHIVAGHPRAAGGGPGHRCQRGGTATAVPGCWTGRRWRCPSLALVFADGGYAGRLVAFARRLLRIVVQVVRKPEGQRGSGVSPR